MDSPVQYVKGIGPKRAGVLGQHGVETVADLLYYLPRKYLDRTTITKVKDIKEGDGEMTVVGRVESFGIRRGRKPRFVLILYDNTDFLTCVWVGGVDYWRHKFRPGEFLAVSGRPSYYGGWQIFHPDFDRLSDGEDEELVNTGAIISLYPSTAPLKKFFLTSRGFRRVIKAALDSTQGRIGEILSDDIIKRNGLFPLEEALNQVHFPDDLYHKEQAWKRLKFDELFFFQLMLAYRRKRVKTDKKGISFPKVGVLTRRLIKHLPFQLTDSQHKVLREIYSDMKSPRPMNRLLQGDVGSGKTVVALAAMIIAVENGYQAALMAPTEILAEQHHLTTHRFLENLGLKVVLLIGGQAVKKREQLLRQIKEGQAQFIIGTHALIQEGVDFKRLGLVVIDEQHRFGVMQRAILRKKGFSPDVLVMTATPIPRTLSLTLYGDLDISTIEEMPSGRKPIVTVVRDESKRADLYRFIQEEVQRGRQVYIVYPLVEESEKVDLEDATRNWRRLKDEVFPQFRVGLLHGRLKGEEKEGVMEVFKEGRLDILVCTTVVEVGVDVPNATVMVIEHAERFGLTPLHQLRGRVGRGGERSYCVLMISGYPSPEAKRRLKVMTRTTDGFKIAETDLEIRGPGEFFGTRQHGLPELTIANLLTDGEILRRARREAFSLVDRDSKLMNHPRVREHLIRRYRHKWELAGVG